MLAVARPRKTVASIEAEGNRHKFTKSELEARAASELKVEPGGLEPPRFLTTKTQREEFEKLAEMLAPLEVACELDSDSLGMYVMAREQWASANKKLRSALRSGDLDEMAKATRVQDAAFRQVRACAGDLGLTITSRCRIVAPVKEGEKPPENAFAEFAGGCAPPGGGDG